MTDTEDLTWLVKLVEQYETRRRELYFAGRRTYEAAATAQHHAEAALRLLQRPDVITGDALEDGKRLFLPGVSRRARSLQSLLSAAWRRAAEQAARPVRVHIVSELGEYLRYVCVPALFEAGLLEMGDGSKTFHNDAFALLRTPLTLKGAALEAHLRGLEKRRARAATRKRKRELAVQALSASDRDRAMLVAVSSVPAAPLENEPFLMTVPFRTILVLAGPSTLEQYALRKEIDKAYKAALEERIRFYMERLP